MKKTIYALAFLILSVIFAKPGHAQTEIQIRNSIERSVSSYYNTYGREIFSLPQYKNRAYTFGFAISINQRGKIDTVVFSNKTKSLDSLVSFKNIVKRLNTDEYVFSEKKNIILIGFVLVRKSWDSSIDNFYDDYHKRINPELADFDQYFYNIMPDIEKISYGKSIRLLPAISLVQAEAKH